MKWTPKDIDTYVQAKEYVDTALVLLVPVSMGADMKTSASMSDFLAILGSEIEKQFKGRLMLMPALNYLSDAAEEKKMDMLTEWGNTFRENGFEHVFFLTSDIEWRKREQELEGALIWLPSLPLEHLQDEQMRTMMKEQVRQLQNIFINKWRKDTE